MQSGEEVEDNELLEGGRGRRRGGRSRGQARLACTRAGAEEVVGEVHEDGAGAGVEGHEED
eukprot:8579109-Alexandrium_andersonii.AAC.1